jgi:hypothetical protein
MFCCGFLRFFSAQHEYVQNIHFRSFHVQVRYILQWPHRVNETQQDRLYVALTAFIFAILL